MKSSTSAPASQKEVNRPPVQLYQCIVCVFSLGCLWLSAARKLRLAKQGMTLF
jgi:hypothetical protein